jgi:thymidylate kinase
MLVTISGIVGSGKSTTARRVAEMVSAAGFAPERHRFRFLPLLGLQRRRARDEPPERSDGPKAAEMLRGRGFSPRRLSAVLALGYAARIMAFRLFRVGAGSRCDILDRYFYDNLVQFALSTRRERVYARLLAAVIPRPDLAVLLVAAPETIAARRGNYAPEYLTAVGRQYARLPELFPNLVRIDTSLDDRANDEIQRAVQVLLARGRRAH